MSEQESAEALAEVIAQHCVWSGGLDESATAALIEARDARVRADARREALEDACRAMCGICASGHGLSIVSDGMSAYRHPRNPFGNSEACKAAPIRALMDEPREGEETKP